MPNNAKCQVRSRGAKSRAFASLQPLKDQEFQERQSHRRPTPTPGFMLLDSIIAIHRGVSFGLFGMLLFVWWEDHMFFFSRFPLVLPVFKAFFRIGNLHVSSGLELQQREALPGALRGAVERPCFGWGKPQVVVCIVWYQVDPAGNFQSFFCLSIAMSEDVGQKLKLWYIRNEEHLSVFQGWLGATGNGFWHLLIGGVWWVLFIAGRKPQGVYTRRIPAIKFIMCSSIVHRLDCLMDYAQTV